MCDRCHNYLNEKSNAIRQRLNNNNANKKYTKNGIFSTINNRLTSNQFQY